MSKKKIEFINFKDVSTCVDCNKFFDEDYYFCENCYYFYDKNQKKCECGFCFEEENCFCEEERC